jgi:hypothetical protein
MYDFTKKPGEFQNIYGKSRYAYTNCERGYVGSVQIDL